MNYERKLCSCGAPLLRNGKCSDCYRIGLLDCIMSRPIKQVVKTHRKPVGRKMRADGIETLRKINEGLKIHPKLIYKYRKNGYVKVKYIPELVLTEKGKKLIETA